MFIYRLRSDAWEVILRYLEVSDTIRLFFSGDTTLWACLKPAIRDFVVRIESRASPSLSQLLNFYKLHSTHHSRFHITLGEWYQNTTFVAEQYTAEKWESFFPENLKSLELVQQCTKPPFSSLLQSLAVAAPRLKKLWYYGTLQNPNLPPALEILEFGLPKASENTLSVISYPTFIESLPTTLTHLKIDTRTRIVSPVEKRWTNKLVLESERRTRSCRGR